MKVSRKNPSVSFLLKETNEHAFLSRTRLPKSLPLPGVASWENRCIAHTLAAVTTFHSWPSMTPVSCHHGHDDIRRTPIVLPSIGVCFELRRHSSRWRLYPKYVISTQALSLEVCHRGWCKLPTKRDDKGHMNLVERIKSRVTGLQRPYAFNLIHPMTV